MVSINERCLEPHLLGIIGGKSWKIGFRAWVFILLLSLTCWTATAETIVPGSETASGTSPLEAIPWRLDYAAGIREASAQNKPVFLDFYAPWCGPCKMMDAQTFADPGVIGKLRDFVPIKIDTDQDVSTAFSYRVSGIPRYIILNIHRETIADEQGFIESGQFMDFLEEAKARASKKSDGTILTLAGLRGEPKGPPPVEITGETPREELFEMMANPDPDLRARATEELVRRKSDDLMKALAESLRDPYLGMRIAAWKALTKMGDLKVEFDPWAASGEREKAAERISLGLKK